MRVLVIAVLTAAACFAAAGPGMAAPPGSRDRIVLGGTAALDGAPFDAPYVGAVVVRRGLVTPCQRELPEVKNGRYAISVYARSEAAGCGALGAELFLWTFVHDQIVFSTDSVRWPGNGGSATFDPAFSLASPDGGVGPVVGFAGEVFDRRGKREPPGVLVEASVGTTRCAVATTRRSGSFTGFSIDVVGPEAIAGCTRGATITFRIDGRRAEQTAVNEPGERESLHLSPA